MKFLFRGLLLLVLFPFRLNAEVIVSRPSKGFPYVCVVHDRSGAPSIVRLSTANYLEGKTTWKKISPRRFRIITNEKIRRAKKEGNVSWISALKKRLAKFAALEKECLQNPYLARNNLERGTVAASPTYNTSSLEPPLVPVFGIQAGWPASAVPLAPIREYVIPSSVDGETRYFSETDFDAALTDLSNGRWQLVLVNKSGNLLAVRFPYEKQSLPLNANADDDVIYYPHVSGMAILANSIETTFGTATPTLLSLDYPDQAFSPFVILADNTDARIAAGTNWPPGVVKVLGGPHRMTLLFQDWVAPRASKTYHIIYARFQSDAKQGVVPWQLAVDSYRNWLRPQMEAAGLWTQYPEWMKKAHGFLNVQLENEPDQTWLQDVESRWLRAKAVLPWIQFWGQMSPAGGGCCDQVRELDRRYVPTLVALANRINNEGGHVGYYSKPRIVNNRNGSLTDLTLYDGETNLQWLDAWLGKQRNEWQASAFYIDVLGARQFGDAFGVAQLFNNHWEPSVIVEWMKDLYPSAYLMSASLWGRREFPGRPGISLRAGENHPIRTPEQFGQTVMAPEFRAEYYRDGLPWFLRQMPDFRQLTPMKVQNEVLLDFGPVDGEWIDSHGQSVEGLVDRFAIRFVGALRVPEAGEYTLTMGSDELSLLLLDGVRVLERDGLGRYGSSEVTLALSEGFHPMELQYLERSGPAQLQLSWKPAFGRGSSYILNLHYFVHQERVSSSAFPRLGRYLLGDRMVFEGVSNSDHYLWGYGYDRNYYVERQTFLLGAKLDASSLEDRKTQGHPDTPLDQNLLNPLLEQMISERDRVGWWDRDPVYLDTKGLSELSPEFELRVRRFVDKHGYSLLAIDNWQQLSNVSLTLDGHPLSISIPLHPRTQQPQQLYIWDAKDSAPTIVASFPVSGTIDPLEDIDDLTGTVRGIRTVKLTFDRPVFDPLTGDRVQMSNFILRQSGSVPPPSVIWMREYPPLTYTLLFNRMVTPGECTVLFPEVASAEGARIGREARNQFVLGFLPGDVNGNGIVNSEDGSLFLAHLRNTLPSSLSRDDLNRDGIISVADLNRLMSLFQGVQTTRPWLGKTLPTCPVE